MGRMKEHLEKTIHTRMNALQHWMEGNYHLKRPEVVEEHILTITKFWSFLSDEDKDYIDGARYAIEKKMDWNV